MVVVSTVLVVAAHTGGTPYMDDATANSTTSNDDHRAIKCRRSVVVPKAILASSNDGRMDSFVVFTIDDEEDEEDE